MSEFEKNIDCLYERIEALMKERNEMKYKMEALKSELEKERNLKWYQKMFGKK